ncbi:hypothetical protein AGIG_G7022 [Arapaima gigas]
MRALRQSRTSSAREHGASNNLNTLNPGGGEVTCFGSIQQLRIQLDLVTPPERAYEIHEVCHRNPNPTGFWRPTSLHLHRSLEVTGPKHVTEHLFLYCLLSHAGQVGGELTGSDEDQWNHSCSPSSPGKGRSSK